MTAALQVFETQGLFAPLDAIATAAGVGNATLYRHFPTRDDLVAAVIDDSVHALVAESHDLEATRASDQALAEWLFRVTWRLRIWHDLPSCVAAALDDVRSPMRVTCAPLIARTADLLRRCAERQVACQQADAQEIFELVTALSWAVDRFGDDVQRARRRVALGTAGLFVLSGDSSPPA